MTDLTRAAVLSVQSEDNIHIYTDRYGDDLEFILSVHNFLFPDGSFGYFILDGKEFALSHADAKHLASVIEGALYEDEKGVEGRRRSRRAGARERVMTAGSVDRLTRQRIVENHAAGVFPEWIASSLRVDPATVREITAEYDAANTTPDRRLSIDDRAARLTRAFTRAAAAIASALSELDALHADLAAARSDR